MRHAKSTSYSFEELDGGFGFLILNRYSLDPFGKLVDCDQ
jgi:hypothetical protein